MPKLFGANLHDSPLPCADTRLSTYEVKFLFSPVLRQWHIVVLCVGPMDDGRKHATAKARTRTTDCPTWRFMGSYKCGLKRL